MFSLPLPRHQGLLAALAAALLFYLVYLGVSSSIVERLRWWLDSADRNPAGLSIGLNDYRWDGQRTLLTEILANLSGLTFDADNNRLLAVVNNPEEVLTLDLAGNITGRYPLQDFVDTEGIAHLGGDRVAVVEERSHSIYFIDLPALPGPLRKQEFRALQLGIDYGDNDGFEGLAYDRLNDRLFVVKERSPRRLYQVNGLRESLAGRFNLSVLDRSGWLDRAGELDDLSSIEIDPVTQHLLLLSDESQRVVELTGDGVALGDLRLDRGGWQAPRPEGIAIDSAGTLYVVSEPNEFYRLYRRGEAID